MRLMQFNGAVGRPLLPMALLVSPTNSRHPESQFSTSFPGSHWCREPFLEDLCVDLCCLPVMLLIFARLVELKKEYQERTGGLDCCTSGAGRQGYTWKYANDSTDASILALAAFEAKTVPR